MKNKNSKSENIFMTAVIIVIVAITSSAVTWNIAKKTQSPTEQEIVSPIKNSPTIIPTPKIENPKIEKNKNNDACNGIKQIKDSRDKNNPNYSIVSIGTQCWLGRNLNVGEMIKGIKNQEKNQIIEKYCNSDDEKNCEKYGGLYQWDEAMQGKMEENSQGICPSGWHVPSHDDWYVLSSFLTDSERSCDKFRQDFGCFGVGTKLKLTGPGNFNLVFGGYRFNEGEFYPNEVQTQFWTSTKSFTSGAWGIYLVADDSGGSSDDYPAMIGRADYLKSPGFSVRCIKD